MPPKQKQPHSSPQSKPPQQPVVPCRRSRSKHWSNSSHKRRRCPRSSCGSGQSTPPCRQLPTRYCTRRLCWRHLAVPQEALSSTNTLPLLPLCRRMLHSLPSSSLWALPVGLLTQNGSRAPPQQAARTACTGRRQDICCPGLLCSHPCRATCSRPAGCRAPDKALPALVRELHSQRCSASARPHRAQGWHASGLLATNPLAESWVLAPKQHVLPAHQHG